MKPEIKETLGIIGMPLDVGASLRGASLGPEAIRLAGLSKRLERIGYKIKDYGNIDIDQRESRTEEGSNLKNLNVIKKANEDLSVAVDKVMKAGEFPLVIGGDHSMAIGTIKGVLKNVKRLGVIWLDAHGDINTSETSPSGNIHGMPVSALMGFNVPELNEIGGVENKLDGENIVFVGQRDLDEGERKILREKGVKIYTMHEVDMMGIRAVMEEAIEYISKNTDGIHVSFDMDVLDPEVAPGTGTKVPGGLDYREAHLVMEMLANTEKVVSLEIVEVNPLLDNSNKTAEAAVALAGSLLGEWLI